MNQLSIAMLLLTLPAAACGSRSAPEGEAERNAPATAKSQSAVVPVTTRSDTSAVREFVQQFYDWYAPMAERGSRVPAFWSVLPRPGVSPELREAFRADSAAWAEGEAKTRELIDVDPFLHSQDPCAPYRVEKVVPDGPAFGATVVEACPGRAGSEYPPQRVVVVVERRDSLFEISNVRFDSLTSVRSLLCQFAMADRKLERRPSKCL